MKKIVFFIIKNSIDDPKTIFLYQNKNPLFKYRNNKFFLDSIGGLAEEIIVRFEYLVFDETLYKKLVSLKDESIKEAEKISIREIGSEHTKGSLNGLIYSQIYKLSYDPPRSIFYFCALLFVKMLMEHKLFDGNKRVAVSFLIALLRYFGYNLDWSKDLKQNYQNYETKVEGFVKKLEKEYNDNNILEIEAWIRSHSMIALEWR